MEAQSLVDALKATPASLRAAVRALQGGEIAGARGADDWSLLDVVRHVRASDAILSPRIFQVLVRSEAPLPAFDERAWGALIAAADVPVDAQLAALAIQRAELVAVLRTLSDDQWQRRGVHEELGPQTVAVICEQIVEHEAEHLTQARAIVSAAKEGG
jgi:hypothetical protein